MGVPLSAPAGIPQHARARVLCMHSIPSMFSHPSRGSVSGQPPSHAAFVLYAVRDGGTVLLAPGYPFNGYLPARLGQVPGLPNRPQKVDFSLRR